MEIRIKELLERLARLEGALLEHSTDRDIVHLIQTTVAGYEARIEYLRGRVPHVVHDKRIEHFLG